MRASVTEKGATQPPAPTRAACRHKSAVDDATDWMRVCIAEFGAPKSANTQTIAAYLNAHLVEDHAPPSHSPRTAAHDGEPHTGRAFSFREAGACRLLRGGGGGGGVVQGAVSRGPLHDPCLLCRSGIAPARPRGWPLELCQHARGAWQRDCGRVGLHISGSVKRQEVRGGADTHGGPPLSGAGLGSHDLVTTACLCSAEHKAAKAQADAASGGRTSGLGTATPAAGAAAAAAAPRPVAAAVKSVLSMTRDMARSLGVPWFRMAQVGPPQHRGRPDAKPRRLPSPQIKSALAEDLLTISLGVAVEMVPRRYLQWVNKPQRNRITADFAGLHSQITCLCVAPDSATIAVGFKSTQVHLIDAGTGEVLRELTSNGHSEGITCLTFSSDGMRLASGSHDFQAREGGREDGGGELLMRRTSRQGRCYLGMRSRIRSWLRLASTSRSSSGTRSRAPGCPCSRCTREGEPERSQGHKNAAHAIARFPAACAA